MNNIQLTQIVTSRVALVKYLKVKSMRRCVKRLHRSRRRKKKLQQANLKRSSQAFAQKVKMKKLNRWNQSRTKILLRNHQAATVPALLMT